MSNFNYLSNLIVMPDGNAVSPMLIKQVSLYKKGVLCRDAQQRMIVWIPVTSEENGKRVRDILIQLSATNLTRYVQPDWSFLNDEVVAG